MESWWSWAVAGSLAGAAILAIRIRIGGRKFAEKVFLEGKTVIITGANCGIGKAAAIELAKRKGRVILACRDVLKGQQAVQDIRRKTSEGDLVVKHLDLASFASIRDFVTQIENEEPKVDILINNAGVMGCPFATTEDGLEMQMGTNHFGHFLLTNLLLDKLKKSAPSRIVVVSSGLSKRGTIEFANLNGEKEYNRIKAYGNSKLANNLFSRELASRLEGSGVNVYCLSPGMVNTNLGRHHKYPLILKMLFYPLYLLLVKNPHQGAQTVLYCALSEKIKGETGKMYRNCAVEEWKPKDLDEGLGKKLWEVSEKTTKLA